jgi:hypothetical protein
VFGRNLSILGTDGSHSTVAVFFYLGRLYEIEGTTLGNEWAIADSGRHYET